MDMPEVPHLRGIHQRSGCCGDEVIGHWSIGDAVVCPASGIVVDIEDDAVIVARRNASGRYMEIVFVGEAIRALRRA
jgi:hypothetical protein